MKNIRTPRIWLLTTAALIFAVPAAASAQSTAYHTGTPTMVAAAPGLPSVPAEQIARDVKSEYNPRTARSELTAAPFDPFEEDPNLAGSLRLSSGEGAVAIDGQTLRNGAMVEVDFYYNSPSDDPFGGRNYSDASFVNGQLAPVVKRDTRILECSTRVENVVYDHASYYRSAPRLGIYRPYRHYVGHSGFGFGFGSNYFGPGYRYYDRSRSRRNRSSGGIRSNTHRLVLDAVRGGGHSTNREDRGSRDESRDRDRDRDRNVGGRQGGSSATPSIGTSSSRNSEMINRARGLQSFGTELPRAGRTSNSRTPTPMSIGVPGERIVIGTGSIAASNTSSRSAVSPPKLERRIIQSESKRPENRQAASPRSDTRRSEPKRSEPKRSAPKRSEPKRSSQRRNEPKRSSSSRSIPKRSAPSRSSSRKSSKRFLDFFPNNGYGRQVVTSRSVDCAREDKLQVFVSNERLDAARFDGLTLIALDAQGGETPIYIPPNYIEGFRLATSGQIRPQGYTAVVPHSGPSYVQPSVHSRAPTRIIEAVPCPSGTSKQPDGTCLQNQIAGYPTR